MHLLLSQRHVLRVMWFPALFALNPLELTKELPIVRDLLCWVSPPPLLPTLGNFP
jgi:hypothetical protein